MKPPDTKDLEVGVAGLGIRGNVMAPWQRVLKQWSGSKHFKEY